MSCKVLLCCSVDLLPIFVCTLGDADRGRGLRAVSSVADDSLLELRLRDAPTEEGRDFLAEAEEKTSVSDSPFCECSDVDIVLKHYPRVVHTVFLLYIVVLYQ